MKSLYDTFATDKDSETSGVWLQFGETDEGLPIRIKVARAGGSNVKFRQKIAAIYKPFRTAIQNGSISPEKLDAMTAKGYAGTVVIGWENIADQNGNILEFNDDNVVKLLTDLPDLFTRIIEYATDMATFQDENREAAVKN